MYPFTFEPILKEIIWGGTDIRPFKGLPAGSEKIGESWELSHVEGNYSTVANGPLAGQTIDDLIRRYGSTLLGKKTVQQFGTTFPLLIKFIDAQDNLSVQVHPDDRLAQQRHHSPGKTEMWYVVNATPGATLYSGFSRPIDADEYLRRVADNSLTDVLQRYDVAPGDVFFLPAGRVHAIGAGCFVAEIQQTSNITYRIYDYDRRDAEGNTRPLHVDLARDAIDYTASPDGRTTCTPIANTSVPLVTCKYFTTSLLYADKPIKRDLAALDSFVICILTEGSALIRDNDGHELALHCGQTVLIPAATQHLQIIPSPHVTLLETHV
ncbi:MAG: class I mannose-6-phosphate isomerase [Tannerella sp.]|jgi:mannose-6-phosphate isomerase|nr:class I mannose-6-phosphate isomerase [Tannerella sp.]